MCHTTRRAVVRTDDMSNGSIGRTDAPQLRSDGRETALTRAGGQILVGDVRDVLRGLDAESVHVCVTSPPYWSLRSYSTDPQLWGGLSDCDHDFQTEPTA